MKTKKPTLIEQKEKIKNESRKTLDSFFNAINIICKEYEINHPEVKRGE